ncbi:hypothetical protein IF1G_10409 [Cordyceps javanica]|uniref:Uncharacterized protein n=1 Tax=Cordyceps javanica TaxID=43265 RepID=A0A545UN49_9HYPO|nr:hypothetical protein IF1G_10409 [Cordyceps javanica]TQW02639.1 hypothetical protein IF2G_09806 [Cordyceps javanica]
MLMQSLLIHIFPVIAYALTALSRAQCGETEKRICYGLDGGDSQHVNLADVKYVAEYLRFIARSNEGAARFWNMPKTAGNCPEWTLPVPDGGTVLALAKHVSPEIRSSILYEDLASAIDGGLWATPMVAKWAWWLT